MLTPPRHPPSLNKIFRILLLLLGFTTGYSESEILVNTDFKDDLEGWDFPRNWDEYEPLEVEVTKKKKGNPRSVQIEIPHVSHFYYARMEQPISIENDKTYQVKFEVRSETGQHTIRSHVSQGISSTWTINGLMQVVEVTSDWTTHLFRFKAREILPINEEELIQDVRLRFGLGKVKGRIFFRNISLIEDDLPYPEEMKHGVREDPEDPKFATVDLSEPREWTSTTGSKIHGVLISSQMDNMVFREVPSGRIIQVKLSFLSPEDQAVIQGHTP